MQINRLFEIVYVLLERGSITARELAKHFEVSTKTIYRDVETLSGAGIPIYMTRGQNGGIQLMQEYVFNKALLSSEEQQDILASLHGLRAVDALSEHDTLEKLQQLFQRRDCAWLEVDFGDWGNVLRTRFELIRDAILARKIIEFDYITACGERSHRRVEPMQLWFREHTWYLRSYCLDKSAARLFRLSRMRNTIAADEHYAPHAVHFEEEFPTDATTEIRMRISGQQEYRVFDEFREEDVIRNNDGTYDVVMNFILDEWVYGYILSFGESAEVLSPESVRGQVSQRLRRCLEKYSK